MSRADKLFRLDPVETKVVKPTSQFQALSQSADASIATQSTLRGLQAFAGALGNVAKFAKQEQIRSDIKTAKDAAARDEAMPGSLLPVAEDAYNDIVDINTKHAAILEAKKFAEGEEFNVTVNDPNITSGAKTDLIEQVYDNLFARSAQTIQNPEVLNNLRLDFNTLKEDGYKKVYEAERNHRTAQGIEGIANIINEAKAFSKITGAPLKETFTDNWVNNVAKDLGVSHPYISEPERKLIAFQMLSADEDIIADSDVIEELMGQNFSKGFTYRSLYFGKGQDAEEFRKIYDEYLKKQVQYFKNIEDKQKSDDKARIQLGKDTVWKTYLTDPNQDLGPLAAQLSAYGLGPTQVNTYIEGLRKYNETVFKEQVGSKAYTDVQALVLDGSIKTEVELQEHIQASNLASSTEQSLKLYLGEENTQRKTNVETYTKSVKLIKNNLVSLLKTELKNKNDLNNLLLSNEPVTPLQMSRILAGTNIDADELRVILNDANDLVIDMQTKAESNGFADAAAEGAGNVPPERLRAFQNEIQARVKELAERARGVLAPGAGIEQPTAVLEEPKGLVELPEEAPAPKTFDSFAFNADNIKIMKNDQLQRQDIKESIEDKQATSWFDRLANLFKTDKSEEQEVPDLIVEAPRSPEEQEFYEKLASGDPRALPDAIAKIREKPPVPTPSERQALIDSNVEAQRTIQPEESSFLDNISSSIAQGFSEVMSIFSGDQPEAKPLSELPAETQADIQRQQEGREVEHVEPDVKPLRLTEISKRSERIKGLKTDNEIAVSDAIDSAFPDNKNLHAVLMSQIKAETGDFGSTTKEIGGGGGIGLIQFTGDQREAFERWLSDNDKEMDASSSLEYIKLLVTGDNAFAAQYHDIGAGNRAKGRNLIANGTVEELSDFFTDKVIRPFSEGGKSRKAEREKRRKDAISRSGK